MLKVLVIDAQGGGIGKQLISELRRRNAEVFITAVGTNSQATVVMKKAGADVAATGENSVVVCSRHADVIAGPIGIVIADALYGEVTPKMAVAVGQADAKRVLIPINKCDNIIAGISNVQSLGTSIEEAVSIIMQFAEKGCC